MKSILLTSFIVVCVLFLNARPAAQKHVVKKGETLYSICREYDLKLTDLLKANPVVAKSKTIKPGEQLVIPGAKSFSTPGPSVNRLAKAGVLKPTPVPSTPGVQYHEENERAKINTPAVQQTASIANVRPVTQNEPPVAAPAFSVKTSSADVADYQSLFTQYAIHGYNVVKTRGQANYLSENTSGNPYLALYNDAEAGSVIEVMNMMNKKTLYVKVIGRLSSLDSSHEIILKLSHQAAAQIGAADDKFLVEVAGVKP